MNAGIISCGRATEAAVIEKRPPLLSSGMKYEQGLVGCGLVVSACSKLRNYVSEISLALTGYLELGK